LATLVSELIALSKLQGAADSFDRVPVSVDAVLDDVLARTATIAAAAGTAVTVGGTPGLTVSGDRTMLVTAVTNLVDNAIHHSPAGTPVSISRTLRDGLVQVAVTDRGSGIPAAQQERVFERFFRGDPARSRDTGGTGLGLAIVKHVAVNHGGGVGLWSRVGTGSTFTLSLPADRPVTTISTAPDAAAVAPGVGPPSTSGSPAGARSGSVPTRTGESIA
jgi:two-component system sensor histidine kinase SenX3